MTLHPPQPFPLASVPGSGLARGVVGGVGPEHLTTQSSSHTGPVGQTPLGAGAGAGSGLRAPGSVLGEAVQEAAFAPHGPCSTC